MKKHLRIVPAQTALGFLALATLLAFFCLPSCKDKASDPLWVANQYFAALEKGDAAKAYDYLSDRALLIKNSKGGEMMFMARPDKATYEKIVQGLPRIEVTSIERLTDMSAEGKLEVFQVQARTKERGRNVERESSKFLLYLAPDVEGHWKVLLPRP
ncbi:hypothetical protein GX441_02425 [bacterium]|nr:hypothetical protein [bacterium]